MTKLGWVGHWPVVVLLGLFQYVSVKLLLIYYNLIVMS